MYQTTETKIKMTTATSSKLLLKHIKSKAATSFFFSGTIWKITISVSLLMPHISIPARDREDGDVTYPYQRDGPEGYDSPVPASDMPAHQTQERAWQANKRTTTHTLRSTTNSNTHCFFQRHRDPPNRAKSKH